MVGKSRASYENCRPWCCGESSWYVRNAMSTVQFLANISRRIVESYEIFAGLDARAYAYHYQRRLRYLRRRSRRNTTENFHQPQASFSQKIPSQSHCQSSSHRCHTNNPRRICRRACVAGTPTTNKPEQVACSVYRRRMCIAADCATNGSDEHKWCASRFIRVHSVSP